MSGDGLTDLVRIRNGEVCYWPNLGYGRFGAKVTMDRSPRFDSAGPVRRHAASGSPTSTGRAPPTSSISRATRSTCTSTSPATRWGSRRRLGALPARRQPSRRPPCSTCSATARPAWSGRHRCPAMRARPMRYIDLMGGQKPHLLVRVAQQPGRGNRASSMRRPPSSTSPTSWPARPGSRGCRSRSTSSSGSKPTTTSAATASSRATPTTTATSTASSASSAASAASTSGTPKSSPRSRKAACFPAAGNQDPAYSVPPV